MVRMFLRTLAAACHAHVVTAGRRRDPLPVETPAAGECRRATGPDDGGLAANRRQCRRRAARGPRRDRAVVRYAMPRDENSSPAVVAPLLGGVLIRVFL